MKTTLYMVVSLNGFVAKEDNSEEFFTEGIWKVFVELADEIGAVIWGRKTHDIVRSWDEMYLNSIKKYKTVVVSANPKYDPGEDFERAASPKEALKRLKKAGYEKALVTGGSNLNSSFMKEGLVDEIILSVDSVVIGRGIPLFAPNDFEYKLKLLGSKKIMGDAIRLHYKVVK